MSAMPLRSVTLDALTIEDEASFDHVALYGRLAAALRKSGHTFRVPERTDVSWDRATFLNLTFWAGSEATDVLTDTSIPADVVAHVAWHHLVGKRIARDTKPGVVAPEALRFGESIASAFDLYLVGRLLHNVPDSDFITSQVPIMSAAAEQAGLDEEGFSDLLAEVVEEPERAFEDLRALLFDVMTGLSACRDVDAAMKVLEGHAAHRFAPLLHHYELSNWVLHERAYAVAADDQAAVVHALDRAMRDAKVSLDVIVAECLSDAR